MIEEERNKIKEREEQKIRKEKREKKKEKKWVTNARGRKAIKN
jgi:hypothetical protein